MINTLLSIFGIVAVFIIIGFGGEIGKQITKKDPQTDTNTETYFGMIEYTFESTGVTHLVFQKADSDKSFCNELNEGYLLGLKTTCPDCAIKSKFCSTSLPSAYQDIFSDKPMVLPFLSAPNKRIVVLGIPVQQAISLCHEMAEAWRMGMNQEAKCITKTVEGSLKLFADAEQDVFSCAMIVAKSIESESSEIMSSKAEVLAEIASKYADIGQIDRATKIMNQALETANAINGEFWKASALTYIARQYAEAGQFTEALDTANAINDEFWKANSLAEIAGMYAKAGQTDKTAQLLTQALRTAYGIEGEYLAWTLAHIAGEHAKAGQKEKAEQLLRQAYETAKEMETLYWKAEALANIASNYAVAGLIDKSAELLTHAFEVTHRIIDGWSRDLAYVVIADEYTKLEMLTQALETANTISREYAKDPTLAQIAGKYAEAGQFTEALDTANAINDENEKARALANIANEYAEKGEINRAAKLLNQALETVYSSNHELWKATMLAEIAGTYAKAGQTDKTAQLLTQALRTAYGIEDELSKARVLTMIGGKFFDASIQRNEQDKIILHNIKQSIAPMSDK